jgi:hypothetical protein
MESTNYSMWKIINKMSPPLRKPQGTRARTNIKKKAYAFAKHLAKVFHPHPSKNEPEEEEALISWKPLTSSNHQSTTLLDQKWATS